MGPNTDFAFGHQTDLANSIARFFPAYRNVRPTNGMQAFFTFAPLCNTLNLYGFEGGSTYDGHPLGADHNVHKEHALLDRAARGELVKSDMDADWTAMWLWLKQYVVERGRQGCIHRILIRPADDKKPAPKPVPKAAPKAPPGAAPQRSYPNRQAHRGSVTARSSTGLTGRDR